MKKLLVLASGLIMMASCSAPQVLAVEDISLSPKRERQALIYEDKVVIVTRTTLTPLEYALIKEKTALNGSIADLK